MAEVKETVSETVKILAKAGELGLFLLPANHRTQSGSSPGNVGVNVALERGSRGH